MVVQCLRTTIACQCRDMGLTLVQEDPTYLRATKHMIQLLSPHSGAREPQTEKPAYYN